ncbi:uncharacterized protein K02A2.6-like [Stylophora pistillata]|uniref:uncharacterized protein K02A2.6-like n=1 Tax=Stylophora pistillata TaxID=50429 RepID=UPI000C055283|nr:uncharacterized protein K02A2.6-like [Stylophora pistillata]
MAHPLYELLGNRPWNWTSSCEQAFSNVKQALTSETTLTHYNPELPVELSVNASPHGLGAVIMHVYSNGIRRPIAYASRTLKEHEQRYCQIDKEVLQDCLLWGVRVIIPTRYQNDMLEELHTEHPCIVRMKELARTYIWWPNIDLEIKQTVRSCGSCQRVRKSSTVAPLAPRLWPSNPRHRIHIDFAEYEKKHYLIALDAHSRWPEIFYMPQNTRATATIAILQELFARYGIPIHCVSDNGPHFLSEEFAHFLKMNSVKRVRVAPYHAASNGLAERMVQSFKNHLKAYKGSKLSIQQRITNFLLSYRSLRHPTTGRTPTSLFLSRELRTRPTLLRPNLEEKVVDSQAKQKATHDKYAKFREFYPRDRVLAKDLRKEDTWWQGSIAERSGLKSYRVVLNDGRVWKRHVDHVRRDGMGRSASEPGGEREYQDQSLEVPWAIPVRSDISGQPQVPPDAHESVSAETDSAQDQKQDVTPPVTA